MWPALQKSTTYTHYSKDQFSSSMDTFINTLINYQYTTVKCWWVCFSWGLFLSPVRRPWVFGCLLNATGWLVQAATFLEIATQLVDDIGHGFSYILWQFGWVQWGLFVGYFPWKLLNLAVACHFVAPLHPPPFISI